MYHVVDDDESPAWGFHAERIDAQSGGYIDFTDAVLKIKDIPILYLPRLKIPLKSERVKEGAGVFPPIISCACFSLRVVVIAGQIFNKKKSRM